MTVFRQAKDGWVEVPVAAGTDIDELVAALESFVDQATGDDRLLITRSQADDLATHIRNLEADR